MYTPSHFAEHDLRALDTLFATDSFITLITQHTGELLASHLPVLFRRQGEHVTLRGHWAKANPQWQGIESQSVLVVVHGPHAYISPNWYANPTLQVPTWNYAVAHLNGHIRTLHDVDELESLVAELATQFEPGNAAAWRFPDSAPSQRGALKGIVGFEFLATRVTLKMKLGQNHPEANVLGAIAGLRSQEGEDDQAVANLMEHYLRQRESKE